MSTLKTKLIGRGVAASVAAGLMTRNLIPVLAASAAVVLGTVATPAQAGEQAASGHSQTTASGHTGKGQQPAATKSRVRRLTATRAAKRKPPAAANRQRGKAPKVKRNKAAAMALAYPINITNERYERTGPCRGPYRGWSWYRICPYNYFDGGGYLTQRVNEYEYWNGFRYVPYYQQRCTTAISGVCYGQYVS